jgi:hypothetical protein
MYVSSFTAMTNSATTTPKKHSKLGAMLTHQCPGCRSTSMYENPKVYTWQNMGTLKKQCELCGTNFTPETGFYFGAAYVNWALTVALWVSVLVSLKLLDFLGLIDFGFLTHPKTFLITGLVVTAIIFPYLYRVSRSIWAHMHIKSKV